jgi:hypothetical protein
MASAWLPVRRNSGPDPRTVTSVKCPRKGPIPSEISLLKCGQLNDAHPERCSECRCDQAMKYAEQLASLRGTHRGAQQGNLAVFAAGLSLIRSTEDQDFRDSAASVSARTSSSSESDPEVV